MNSFHDNGEEMAHLSDMALTGDELELLGRVKDSLDIIEEMPSEVRFFFDPQYNPILSQVPPAMVKRIWALETIKVIKNDPDCDGISVAIDNFYRIMRAYDRRGAREFLEMISIQTNEEETIDDTLPG